MISRNLAIERECVCNLQGHDFNRQSRCAGSKREVKRRGANANAIDAVKERGRNFSSALARADRSRERTGFSNRSAKTGNELTGSAVAVEEKEIWRGLERNFATGSFYWVERKWGLRGLEFSGVIAYKFWA